MFENLSQRLTRSLRNVMGQGRLTEDNIKETLREVRLALLEADVALPVVKDFIAEVKTKALGTEGRNSLRLSMMSLRRLWVLKMPNSVSQRSLPQ